MLEFEKIGRIFNPVDFSLISGVGNYAQSPQAIVLEDRIRIFFTTRKKDTATTFLSYPFFVDFDYDFKVVLWVSQQPVIGLGERGTFDEHGIFPFSPIKIKDKIYAYTTGWTRRRSVPTDSGIGLVISDDQGETFQRSGNGPILGASLKEPFLVSDGFVFKDRDKFHMWYIFGERWLEDTETKLPERVYKIAHASSFDCVSWDKSGTRVLQDKLGTDECQALPTVIKTEKFYLMAYCYRHATNFRTDSKRGYRLGFATSTDLLTWNIVDASFQNLNGNTAWDQNMQCYPNLFSVNKNVFLLYNGKHYGREGFGLAQLKNVKGE